MQFGIEIWTDLVNWIEIEIVVVVAAAAAARNAADISEKRFDPDSRGVER